VRRLSRRHYRRDRERLNSERQRFHLDEVDGIITIRIDLLGPDQKTATFEHAFRPGPSRERDV